MINAQVSTLSFRNQKGIHKPVDIVVLVTGKMKMKCLCHELFLPFSILKAFTELCWVFVLSTYEKKRSILSGKLQPTGKRAKIDYK